MFRDKKDNCKSTQNAQFNFKHTVYPKIYIYCSIYPSIYFRTPVPLHGHCSWAKYVCTGPTVYPKKYAHGFVVLCLVVVMQSFIMNSNEVFIHIHQGWFAVTGAIVRLPQCQWSKPDGYEKISHCITTTKHSKAVTVCIFLGIYCICYLTCPPKVCFCWCISMC